MSRPRYCPGCGAALPAGEFGAVPFSNSPNEDEGSGWDCYCHACHWSGDILPDDEGAKEECESVELALNPHFVAAMLRIVEALDKTTIDRSKVRRGFAQKPPSAQEAWGLHNNKRF